MLRKLSVLMLLCIGLPGCTGFGPSRLESDQLQYARAISDSQNRQILLNIVRLRYADMPTFFSANQVVSSYTLERRAELALGRPDSINHDGASRERLGNGWLLQHPLQSIIFGYADCMRN